MKYPEFYQSHIQDVISRYNAARAEIVNAAAFVFLTDLHLNMNSLSSVPLIKQIGRQTDVKTVLCGGDFPVAFGSQAQCVFQLENTFNYLAPIKEDMRLYIARGNHDALIANSRDDLQEHIMPYAQVQAYFAAHNSPAQGTVKDRMYLYADDESTKTRYIILDTSEYQLIPDANPTDRHGITEAQLRWLCDTALRFENGEGWSVVILGHIPCCDQIPSACYFPGLNQILQAFKNKTVCPYGDFSGSKAELVMYLCGHNHTDCHALEGNVLHVSTGCDACYKDGGLTRVVGTQSEALFDLFLVDRDKRTIRTFRVGAGKDRMFSY